jgi:hypothetical protein
LAGILLVIVRYQAIFLRVLDTPSKTPRSESDRTAWLCTICPLHRREEKVQVRNVLHHLDVFVVFVPNEENQSWITIVDMRDTDYAIRVAVPVANFDKDLMVGVDSPIKPLDEFVQAIAELVDATFLCQEQTHVLLDLLERFFPPVHQEGLRNAHVTLETISLGLFASDHHPYS